MRHTRRRGLFVTLLVIVLVGALYAAAGFLLAPRLIERQLAALVEERLNQKLTVEKLKVNPFALSIEARGLRVAQENAPPLLEARRVYLDLALLRSGFGRGWVLGEAQTDGLQILLESQRDGRLNVAELMQRWQQRSPPPKAADTAPRITIRHLLAADGMLTYQDRSDKTASTQVLPIRIELENLSTLPDREGRYNVSARIIGGGALTWRGDLSLQPLQSEGDLELQSLKLATAWKFIRENVRLGEPDGWLTVASHYRFSYTNSKPNFALSKLRLHASGVKVVREGTREPMLALKSVEVRDGTFDLARRSLVLPVVSLSDGHLGVINDAAGVMNWTSLARATGTAPRANAPVPSRTDKPRQTADPWSIDVRELALDNIALRYTDLQRRSPLDLQTAAMRGKASLTISAGDTLDLRAHDMNMRVEKVRVPADAPTVQLTHVQLEGGYLELAKQKFGAKQLVADGGSIRLERDAGGTLPVVDMFQSNVNAPAPNRNHASWTYAVESARIEHVDIALSDRSLGSTIAVPIGDLSLRLDNIASAGDKAMAFTATGKIGRGGALAANGSVAQDFSRIDGSVKLDSIALAPLQPLIARYATVDLASGSASASATLAYRRSDGKMSLNASGPFQLDNVRLNEAGNDTLVLAWKRLSSREARLTLGPDRLGIKEIVVDAPEMRIDVSEQREVNLARLFKRQATPDGKVENQPAENQLAQQNEVQFPVHIGEVRLRDGTMDYSDRSLVLPFATHVTNLAGTAAGLGTDRDRRATLQFDGDIGEFGSLEINGRIDALSPTTFVDVGASFENVEMTELSPYTATFLGRKIASGKLWVEVKYRVENGELTGENDVTVHELALGEPVDTPTALKLPLDLAVALLTDSDGVIHAAIPVKGDLHDPKFAIGTVIREALGNLIKKIVSAPFRALAGLFGDKKEQDFGRIEFEPGSAKLKASEKEKLQNVAKAMEERPQLKLIVQAPYSPDADREAMKREKASRDVELALGRTLRPDENPGPVAFESLATQRALEKLSAKKSDPVAQRAWIAQYTKRKGTEPKRAGMILRSKGDPEFYEAMFEWLARTETVADAAMQDLAEERAQAVTETLSAAGIDAERLETAPAHPTKPEKEQKIGAELSLAPADVHRATASRKANHVATQDLDDSPSR